MGVGDTWKASKILALFAYLYLFITSFVMSKSHIRIICLLHYFINDRNNS